MSGSVRRGSGVVEADRQPVSARGRRRDVITVARGGGFLAGGTMLEFVLRFFIGLLLARLLGSVDYGLYSLAITAAGLFALVASLGLDDAMVRYVAILSRRRDEAGVWGTIQIGLGITIPTSVIMGVVLYVTAPAVAEGLFDEPLLTPALRLMAFAVPWLMLSNVLLGITRGFGRMDHAALGENIVPSVVRLVLIGGMSFTGLDLPAALVIVVIADIAASLTMGYFLNRGFSLRPSDHDEARRDVGEIFRFGLPLWLSGLLSKFQKNISALILGTTSSVANVGIFFIVTHVNMIGHAVYRSVTVAVKPLLAQLHDMGDREGLAHIYTATTRWLVLTNIPFFLAMSLYPGSILAIFGESFTVAATALVVLSVAELVNAATGICGSLIDMTGHTRVKLFNSVLWLVLAIVTNAVLVPRFGVLGAAWSYLICVSVVNAARMIEIRILEQVLPSWRAYGKPLLAGMAAMGVGIGLQALWPVGHAFWPALLQGIVVVIVYSALVVLTGLDDDDRHILARLRGKVGHKHPPRSANAKAPTP